MASLEIELRTIARLSAPAALSQLGMTLMAAVDTLLLGHVGSLELAACALGNTWEWTWLCLGFGLVQGSEPLVSQAHGRDDGPGASLALQRGLVVAALASIPIMVAMLLTRPGLIALGQDPEVASVAGRYNLYKLPVVPCFLAYAALRQYLQGRTHMAPATIVMWIGNGVHLVLATALVFGYRGLPALGIDGAAIAESATFVSLAGGLAIWIRVRRLHAGAWRRWDRESFGGRGLWQLVQLGAPVSLQIGLEAWAFSIAALMAGALDRDAVGSHQIGFNLVVLSFMLPLGVSQGAATRVGNLIGAGDAVGMRLAIRASLWLGAGVMALPAAAFVLFRYGLPSLYTSDASVVSLAARLLPVAAAFQLFDGTQVVAGALLRSMGRPNAGALLSLLGYYGLALPLAHVAGFVWNFGLVGIWAALALGVICVAVTLLGLVYFTARQPITRLQLGIEQANAEPAGDAAQSPALAGVMPEAVTS